MKKFEVSYTLPYRHDVTVGISANSAEEAIRIADAAATDGSLWDDSEEMPLLCDDFEEDDGGVLQFEAIEIEGDFVPRFSVVELRRKRKAIGQRSIRLRRLGALPLPGEGVVFVRRRVGGHAEVAFFVGLVERLLDLILPGVS